MVITKALLDAFIMQDSQSSGCLANPTGTNESNRGEIFRQTDNLLYQGTLSKIKPWWWRW